MTVCCFESLDHVFVRRGPPHCSLAQGKWCQHAEKQVVQRLHAQNALLCTSLICMHAWRPTLRAKPQISVEQALHMI